MFIESNCVYDVRRERNGKCPSVRLSHGPIRTDDVDEDDYIKSVVINCDLIFIQRQTIDRYNALD